MIFRIESIIKSVVSSS